MCAILGLVSITEKHQVQPQNFEKALLTMNHRGPDSTNIELISPFVALGHCRLSIIDTSSNSNQPYCIDDNYYIVFNGEIYNFLELRSELLNLGHNFKTEGDTEVLLKSYLEWGEDCVKKFNGMWSFAILDKKRNNLFCSRDRFGVKPFVYSVYNDNFIFSSEIKAIISYFPQLKQPNYNVISNFCRSSVGAQHNETWFENIFRLEPGHNLIISNGLIRKIRYWDYPSKINHKIKFREAVSEYKRIFIDSIKLRMRSDVPVGTLLSSGIDSTSIVYSLRTFYSGSHFVYTAVSESKKYNYQDTQYFADKEIVIDEKEVTCRTVNELNLVPNIIETNYDEFTKKLNEVIYFLESGNSSPAVIPLMQLLKEANKSVKVVLEGQGADELLAGYHNAIVFPYVLDCIKSFKFSKAVNVLFQASKIYPLGHSLMLYFKYLSNKYKIITKVYETFLGYNVLFSEKLRITKRLKDSPYLTNVCFESNLNKLLYHQHTGGLVNLLHYSDAISMANSIESRQPFLDYRLVELAFKLPIDFKFSKNLTKYIHRKSMQNIVPSDILNNRLKFGFNTPLSNLFTYESKSEQSPVSILLSEKSISRNLFNEKKLKNIIDLHVSNKANYSFLLFRLLSVELWFREFID